MPKAPVPEIFSMRTGALVSRDRAALLASADELAAENVAHTFVFQWQRDAEWRGKRLEWTSSSVCFARVPKPEVILIADSGRFGVWGNGDYQEGEIVASGDRRGRFRQIRIIKDIPFAVGTRGLAYRRDQTGWTRVGANVPHASFEAIAGFSHDKLYAVGWDGAIWLLERGNWAETASPTNVILTNVCCAEDDVVYCCGQRGTLLKGRSNAWEVIDHGATNQDFWDVHWFMGKLYVSTVSFLFELAGDRLELVPFGEDKPSSCYHLASADGVLWSIGAKDVMAFDGAAWSRIF